MFKIIIQDDKQSFHPEMVSLSRKIVVWSENYVLNWHRVLLRYSGIKYEMWFSNTLYMFCDVRTVLDNITRSSIRQADITSLYSNNQYTAIALAAAGTNRVKSWLQILTWFCIKKMFTRINMALVWLKTTKVNLLKSHLLFLSFRY